MERLVAEIEEQVHDGEQALKSLEDQLANLGPKDDVMTLTRRHAGLQEALAGSLSAWEEQSMKLDELRGLR